MDFGNEFRKYAVHHKGLNGLSVDQFMNQTGANASRMSPMGMTPYIIEERPMNIAQLDVFSRLMMDRIIFMEFLSLIKLPISFKLSCCSWNLLIRIETFISMSIALVVR